MKNLAECLISQVSDGRTYIPGTDAEEEAFSSSLLWRSISCIDHQNSVAETTYLFHDGSTILQSGQKFWCVASEFEQAINAEHSVCDFEHPYKDIIETYDASIRFQKGGLFVETDNFQLEIKRSVDYVVLYRKTRAVNVLLSIKYNDNFFRELGYFTALDVHDALQIAIQYYKNLKQFI